MPRCKFPEPWSRYQKISPAFWASDTRWDQRFMDGRREAWLVATNFSYRGKIYHSVWHGFNDSTYRGCSFIPDPVPSDNVSCSDRSFEAVYQYWSMKRANISNNSFCNFFCKCPSLQYIKGMLGNSKLISQTVFSDPLSSNKWDNMLNTIPITHFINLFKRRDSASKEFIWYNHSKIPWKFAWFI